MKTRLYFAIILLFVLLPKTRADIPAAPPADKLPQSIPWDQIGAKAGETYHGDGLAVTSTAMGAKLHCAFQQLDGEATREGLWLTSTVSRQVNDRFRVTAAAVGRQEIAPESNSPQPIADVLLAQGGEITVAEQTVRFSRPGLVEEYSVSMDGVRQDFLVTEAPAGAEELRVRLVVSGATVEATPDGARLVLAQSGRKIAYSRLHATDANGRELPARMKVVSSPEKYLAIVVSDAGAAYPVRIDPVFSDANWIIIAGIPGANNTVSASAVDGSGNLYIGGPFTIVGNMLITNLAEWNGSTWSNVGTGVNGPVSALVYSGGNLYVAGSFTTAGGNAANRIAVWNGATWSTLGMGLNNTVYALAISGGNVYVGGTFTTAGSGGATRVAEWNGSTWSALGIGLNSTVLALATLGTNLYVGGQFTFAGSTPSVGIGQWSGTSWLSMGGGVNGEVSALTVLGTNLIAGGSFTMATNTGPVAIIATNIAQWNGSTWSALGTGVNNLVQSLATSGTNLYVGGYFNSAGGVTVSLIARWNGNSWSSLGSGVGSPGGAVTSILISGNNLIAGGGFSIASGVGVANLAQWNGTSWSALLPGFNNNVDAITFLGTNLYVGGNFLSAGNGPANYIAQWNGSSWSTMGSGMNSTVTALATLGTNIYAGGFFTMAGGVAATNIARWNGSSWSAVGTGFNGPNNFSYLNALTVFETNLLAAGGSFTLAGGGIATNIALWDGNNWSALGLGIGGSAFASVNTLLASGTNLYAGGFFTLAGSTAATNIAEYNSTGWSALGLGLGGSTYALAMFGTNLIAGGSFNKAGGLNATNIAQWNGSAWSAMGLGVGSTVEALAVSDTNLYVGGTFTKANGNPANYLARWDGGNWYAVGSGMNNSMFCLLASGNTLFAGGAFTTAGGIVSGHVAEAVTTNLTWLSIQAGVPGPKTNTLTYLGVPNAQHIILYTTNLTTGMWTPLVTNIPAINGVGMVLDPGATDRQRFYILDGP